MVSVFSWRQKRCEICHRTCCQVVFSFIHRCLHLDLVISYWPSSLVLLCHLLHSLPFPEQQPLLRWQLSSLLLIWHICYYYTDCWRVRQPLSGWLILMFTTKVKQPVRCSMWPAFGEPAKQRISQCVSICCQWSVSLFPCQLTWTWWL